MAGAAGALRPLQEPPLTLRACAVLSVIFLGCGLPDAPAPAVPSPTPASTEAITVAQPTDPSPRPVPRFDATLRPNVEADLNGLTPGARVFLVAGVMSCGFWELGRTSLVTDGKQVKAMVPVDQLYGYGMSVFAFVDADGDGLCTNEAVFQADLGTGTAAIDFGQAPTGYGSCWLFQP